MKRLLICGFLLWIAACGRQEQAGGTTVETTNGVSVHIETLALKLDSGVLGFAARLGTAPSRRLCVLSGQDTLSYAVLDNVVWVYLDSVDVDASWDLVLRPDEDAHCPASDSAAVFGADPHLVVQQDWGGKRFDGREDASVLGDLLSAPSSLTLSAEFLADSGVVNADVLTVGDVAGFRIAREDDRVAIYSYASYAGVSNWAVLGSFLPVSGEEWLRVDLVIDGEENRMLVYGNGELLAMSSLPEPLSYDKIGTNIIAGKHASGNKGFFQGLLGTVSVARTARSADWIRLAAWQGRSGTGWKTEGSWER